MIVRSLLFLSLISLSCSGNEDKVELPSIATMQASAHEWHERYMAPLPSEMQYHLALFLKYYEQTAWYDVAVKQELFIIQKLVQPAPYVDLSPAQQYENVSQLAAHAAQLQNVLSEVFYWHNVWIDQNSFLEKQESQELQEAIDQLRNIGSAYIVQALQAYQEQLRGWALLQAPALYGTADHINEIAAEYLQLFSASSPRTDFLLTDFDSALQLTHDVDVRALYLQDMTRTIKEITIVIESITYTLAQTWYAHCSPEIKDAVQKTLEENRKEGHALN